MRQAIEGDFILDLPERRITYTDINGATSDDHTLGDEDLGKTIKVRGRLTDDWVNPEILTSAATVAVAAKANTPPTPTLASHKQGIRLRPLRPISRTATA